MRKHILKVTIACLFLYVLSTGILVVASLHKLVFLSIFGPVDVLIALMIIGISFYLYIIIGKIREDQLPGIPLTFFIRCFLFAGTLVGTILFVIWIFRARLDMNILLPGLAWRLFIFLYTLPLASIVLIKPSTN